MVRIKSVARKNVGGVLTKKVTRDPATFKTPCGVVLKTEVKSEQAAPACTTPAKTRGKSKRGAVAVAGPHTQHAVKGHRRKPGVAALQ